jgi:hypothetical protein
MNISEKSIYWRDLIAKELVFTTVALAPVREKAHVDYAHLFTPSGVNIEIVFTQTMKLPATDKRPNELEWTEEGYVVIYKGEDSDTSERTVYIHLQSDWSDQVLLGEIIGAYSYIND